MKHCRTLLFAITVAFLCQTTVRAQDDEGFFSDLGQTAEDPSRESSVQNAIIEGVQLSSEPGAEPHEKIVTCYFIFRDKPSSYFYEAKHREKKLVFEFNDTERGVSPIPSASEPPIEGFRIEQVKVDVNKEIKGLKPEWHDVVRVSFFLSHIPEISVKDEYSVISYSFKWTTDPSKVKQYAVDASGPMKTALGVTGGMLLAGGGVALYFYLNGEEPGPPPLLPLDTTDLPVHPQPFQ
jgi:hypothetical protein